MTFKEGQTAGPGLYVLVPASVVMLQQVRIKVLLMFAVFVSRWADLQ
jgi:hypothetical protein